MLNDARTRLSVARNTYRDVFARWVKISATWAEVARARAEYDDAWAHVSNHISPKGSLIELPHTFADLSVWQKIFQRHGGKVGISPYWMRRAAKDVAESAYLEWYSFMR
jgi:hypothetical protein